MWICYGAVCFSLWSISHFEIEVTLNYICSFYAVIDKHLPYIIMHAIPFIIWVFILSFIALFCLVFLPNPPFAKPPKPFAFAHSSLPLQTEDNTQFLISTDASHSTVTNGMWAQSRLPRPIPVLSQWMDPGKHCSESDSDLVHIQCLSVSITSVLTCVPLPLFPLIWLALSWLSVFGRVFLGVLRSEQMNCYWRFMNIHTCEHYILITKCFCLSMSFFALLSFSICFRKTTWWRCGEQSEQR